MGGILPKVDVQCSVGKKIKRQVKKNAFGLHWPQQSMPQGQLPTAKYKFDI